MSNFGGNTITEYAPGATGNAAPDRHHLRDSLDSPTGLAIDRSGDVFVGNVGNNTITEYAPGASGNVAPIATIVNGVTGPNLCPLWPGY